MFKTLGVTLGHEEQQPRYLKSVVHRNEHGNIIKIAVEKTDNPRFRTPAYDNLVKDGIPPWLRVGPD
ncbi:hypothetical protein GCM10025791_21120 [Halioxenophilus aromaticivorans]|uniref:Uncharacterized protein n=1 Tax=Halioxenophilus aromaticivorans TaxID=1306992 RepID=A0AAV3U3J9_9ALTE